MKDSTIIRIKVPKHLYESVAKQLLGEAKKKQEETKKKAEKKKTLKKETKKKTKVEESEMEEVNKKPTKLKSGVTYYGRDVKKPTSGKVGVLAYKGKK